MSEQHLSNVNLSDSNAAANSVAWSSMSPAYEISHSPIVGSQKSIMSALKHEMAILFGTTSENFDYDQVSVVPDQTNFKRFINLVILLNSIQLGVCVVYESDELSVVCFFCEMSFTIIFSVEALLKIRAQHWKYFRSIWNQIDFSLVLLGILDNIFQMPIARNTTINCKWCSEMSLLRMMRLTRALRLFRILHFNRRLMILAEGLAASVRAMFWVGLLLFVIVYACGIFAYGAFGDEKERIGWEKGYFDSLYDSMLTLFDISILDLWGDVVRPVAKVYPQSLIFFIGYVFISSFGVLNLMIGIIVDSTMKSSHEYKRREEVKTRKIKMRQIDETAGLLFDAADLDGNALLTMEELVSATPAKQKELSEMLQSVDLPPGFTIPDFFMMCSPESDLSKQAFIDAMKRIVFSNQFERDCLLQQGVNDIRRRIKKVEIALEEIHKVSQTTQSLHKLVKQQMTRRPENGIGLETPETLKRDDTLGGTSIQISDVERISGEIRTTSDQLSSSIAGMVQNLESELQMLRLELHKCWVEAMDSSRDNAKLVMKTAGDSLRVEADSRGQDLRPDMLGKSQERAVTSNSRLCEPYIGRTSPSGHSGRAPWIALMRNSESPKVIVNTDLQGACPPMS